MLLDCFGHLREWKSQEQRTCRDYNLSPHWKYWCSLWWCFDHASSAGSKPGGDEWSHCYCTQSRQDVGDFRPIQYSDSVQGRLPQSNRMQAACIALIPIRIKDQGSRHDLNCHAGMSLQLIYHVVSFYVIWLLDHARSQPIRLFREENRYCWCQSFPVLVQRLGQFASNTQCWHDVHWWSCMLWQDQRRCFPKGLMHCHMSSYLSPLNPDC